MKMWFIFEKRALALRSWTCVPSPQSMRKWRSSISRNCAVGDEFTVGIAELYPRMVRCALKEWIYLVKAGCKGIKFS